MEINIIEEIRRFVEEECKKPSNIYGYEPYSEHFVQVHDYAKKLAEESGADVEIVEIAAWLHDIGSIIEGRENHHISGAEIAEKKLIELNYPAEKIERVRHCIFSHRGSQNIERKSKEAEILAEADAMTHFDIVPDMFHIAFVKEGLSRKEGIESVRQKIINSYNKLSARAKLIVQPKYNAAMLLLDK